MTRCGAVAEDFPGFLADRAVLGSFSVISEGEIIGGVAIFCKIAPGGAK